MNEHRYILEPYKGGMNTRYRCPSCQQKDKIFSRYIDTETGEHIHPTVGRCNRESKCGYHYTPKQYFQDNNISFDTSRLKGYKLKPFIPQPKPISFIPVEVFKASLKSYQMNHFVKFLIDHFGIEITNELISRYFLATSKHWKGATVFWQIDAQGKIRTGKIMLYSPTTGKRLKEPYNHIDWVHHALKHPEFKLQQCLFGEHLLIDKTKPIAIVESEKTAVIASVYLPQFIWCAAGGLSNMKADLCKILKGRTVILFPDLNGFEKWSNKAKELSHIATFIVSDLLERKATEAEKKQGFDLADYLIRFDLKDFALPESEPMAGKQTQVEQLEPTLIYSSQRLTNIDIENVMNHPPSKKCGFDITELERYFQSLLLPIHEVQLEPGMRITNISNFIDAHLSTLKANNGNANFLPHLIRLKKLQQYLTN
jgi:hypothetical protein